MATLTEIYTRDQNRRPTSLVIIAGQAIPHRSPSWGNDGPGTVPTASIELFRPLPASVIEGAQVAIYAGFNDSNVIQFNGTIANVKRQTINPKIECVGKSRALKLTYRSLVIVFASVTAVAAVTSLLVAAGLVDYFVDLDAWTIGVTVPAEIDFTTYGDAINQIAQVDGSPFYEMPSGQVRVERKDPIPSNTVFRTYYSGVLSTLTNAQREDLYQGLLPISAIQPPQVTDPLAQPRLRNLATESRFEDVKNRIVAQGAVITSTAVSGEQDSERLSVTAVGPSPFIPTPPQYQEVTIDAPLIDDASKLASYAAREFGLRNRLQKVGSALVDGDPEIFYGATIQIVDLDYTGEADRYFVAGYRSTISDTDFTTEIAITGGPASGVLPLISPFACFQWAVSGKLSQVLPVGIGPGGVGVVITFDGTCSKDFDGTIASYAWSDSIGGVGTGIYFQGAYTPGSSVDVTLTVTDNDGQTDSVTKTVSVSEDDSDVGGQPTLPTFIFSAAEAFAMGSDDGGQTWNDLSAAVLGLTGKFVCCSAQHWTDEDDHGTAVLFITDRGELVVSIDNCANGFRPTNNGAPLTGVDTTPRTYQATPVLGASTAAWFFTVSPVVATGYGYLLFYTANDAKPASTTAWNLVPVTNLFPAGFAINRIRQDYEPNADWPRISEAIRGVVF